jgi:type II secretory pathway component GspD/PulD (secretin)
MAHAAAADAPALAPRKDASPTNAGATVPNAHIPTPEQLAAILVRLGNDDYEVREKASAELAALPPEALPVLEATLKNLPQSPEVSARVEVAQLKIRATAKHAGHPIFVGADPDKIVLSDDIITQIIPLKNLAADQLRKDLMVLVSGDKIDVDTSQTPSNAIIITDTSAKVKRIAEIIQKLDNQKNMHVLVEYRQMVNVNAADAARLINAMFKPADMGAAAAKNPQIEGRIYADSDARTNVVVLNGPPDQVAQALAILEKLEQVDAAGGVVNPAVGRGARGGQANPAARGDRP